MATFGQQGFSPLCSGDNCGSTVYTRTFQVPVPCKELIPQAAQAAICSGNVFCIMDRSNQTVTVDVCGSSFPCCIHVPLRRVFGTLRILYSVQYTDACGNPVSANCNSFDLPINFACPFCPGQAPPCFSPITTNLCRFFTVTAAFLSSNLIQVTVTTACNRLFSCTP